ncbi:Tol biopolymer transport system component [Lipingzhangella halophila]|uniref:Tol biopolymer transport system component n=1 Tax=Lipingzhangella halophila TaxID=1783352 RepID=A0A7W7RI80_9ACTN|nr:PD40 domain-containing protein [Lipingzhangella halophila]MBB4932469.1 Tol biopolymer transport system component [Lipingzhangella halophila]
MPRISAKQPRIRTGLVSGAALLVAAPLALAPGTAHADAYPDAPIVFGAALGDDTAANLYTLRPGQDEPAQLTDSTAEETDPAYSPDASEILYRSNADGPHNILRIDAEGGEASNVTRDTGAQASPTWSPEGERVSYEDHSARRPPDTNGIYTNTPNGDDAEQITVGGRSPDWDPRDEWLAYVHHEGAHNQWRIHWVSPDGSGNSDILSRTDTEITGLEWSPEGDFLAYREQHVHNDIVRINVLDRETRESHTIVREHEGVWNATWSPDGTWLAFAAQLDDGNGIYLVDVADPENPGEPEKVFDLPGYETPDLDWAPR